MGNGQERDAQRHGEYLTGEELGSAIQTLILYQLGLLADGSAAVPVPGKGQVNKGKILGVCCTYTSPTRPVTRPVCVDVCGVVLRLKSLALGAHGPHPLPPPLSSPTKLTLPAKGCMLYSTSSHPSFSHLKLYAVSACFSFSTKMSVCRAYRYDIVPD